MTPLSPAEQAFAEYWCRLIEPEAAKHARRIGDRERILDLKCFLRLRLCEATRSAMNATGPLCTDYKSPQRNYIMSVVKNAAVEWLQQQDVPFQVSRNDNRILAKAVRASESLSMALGREPTTEEVADAIGVDAAKLDSMAIIAPPVPIEDAEHIASDHGLPITEMALNQILDSLDSPVSRMLKRVIYEGMTIPAASKAEGMDATYRNLDLSDLQLLLARELVHGGRAAKRLTPFKPVLDKRIVKQDHKRSRVSQSALARKYNVSRQAIHSLLKAKPSAKRGAPVHAATALVLAIRQSHPHWGASSIAAHLSRTRPDESISIRTIQKILARTP